MKNRSSVFRNERNHLEILRLIERDGLITQQEIADHLGVAIGLVNSFLKRLIHRGYIRVKRVPKRRYLYLLTPKGVAEKGRLTIRFIQDSLKFYRDFRTECKEALKPLAQEGVQEVHLIGSRELAEIAYLTLQEVGIGVSGVYDADPERVGKRFFEKRIFPIEKLPRKGTVVRADLFTDSLEGIKPYFAQWVELGG